MAIDRRSMIKAIGAALCAGAVPKFVPELVGATSGLDDDLVHLTAHSRYVTSYDSTAGFYRYWTKLVIEHAQIHRAAIIT